jgi:hypothetical protein
MNTVINKTLFFGLATFAVACGGKDDDTGSDDVIGVESTDLEEIELARSAWEGTPEGVGLLDFLNAETTTFGVLDNDVPLDRRAAGNLIAHRDGGDRLWGSTDDDIFSNVDEVDAVRFVGARSIDRLVMYAAKEGYVPGGDEILGVYDGVSFTVIQAEATIALANTLEAEVLDFDLALDARAVTSIVEARPIETVDELSRLYYVGRTALDALKIETINEQY